MPSPIDYEFLKFPIVKTIVIKYNRQIFPLQNKFTGKGMRTSSRQSKKGNETVEFLRENSSYEVEDYRVLYFETLKKLHQLTSIQATLNSTNSILNDMEINNATVEYQKKIQEITQKFQAKTKENQSLVQQMKKIKQMSEEKEVNLRKRIEVEMRRNQVIQQELFVLKEQMRILRKELDNQKQYNTNNLNQKNTFPNNKVSMNDLDEPSGISDQKIQKLVEVIRKQQKEILSNQNQIKSLKERLSDSQRQIQRLNQQISKLQEFHRIQLQYKQSIISSLKQEIAKKQARLNQVQQKQLKLVTNRNKNTLSHQQLQHIQSQISMKDKIINRMTVKLQQYEQMISSFQHQQEQLHKQLMQKEILLEKSQTKETNYLREIGLLKSAIQEIKGSYIHSQLVKEQIKNQCKRQQKQLKMQQKQLKLSRMNNKQLSLSQLNSQLSLSQLNTSHSTLCSMPFTPINSLKNSRAHQSTLCQESPIAIKQLNDESRGSLRSIASKASKTPIMQRIKNGNRSFYKKSTLKMDQQSYRNRITPFEL